MHHFPTLTTRIFKRAFMGRKYTLKNQILPSFQRSKKVHKVFPSETQQKMILPNFTATPISSFNLVGRLISFWKRFVLPVLRRNFIVPTIKVRKILLRQVFVESLTISFSFLGFHEGKFGHHPFGE